MEDYLLLVAIGIIIVGSVAPIGLRALVFGRLSKRLDEQWAGVIDEYRLEEIPRRLLLKYHSRMWTGDVADQRLKLLAYQKAFSGMIDSWRAQAVLQIDIDPGEVRLVTEQFTFPGWDYWELKEQTYTSANTHALIRWPPDDRQPMPGVGGLSVAGISESMPDDVHRAIRRASGRGPVWLSDSNVTFVWRLDARLEPRLRETLDDARVIVEWLENRAE